MGSGLAAAQRPGMTGPFALFVQSRAKRRHPCQLFGCRYPATSPNQSIPGLGSSTRSAARSGLVNAAIAALKAMADEIAAVKAKNPPQKPRR